MRNVYNLLLSVPETRLHYKQPLYSSFGADLLEWVIIPIAPARDLYAKRVRVWLEYNVGAVKMRVALHMQVCIMG